MTRKHTGLVLFIGVLTLSTQAISAQDQDKPRLVRGTVFVDANQNRTFDSGEQTLAGVAVSNGREVTATGADGRYELPIDDDTIVFVVKPTGYRTPQDENHVSRFYYIHKPNGSPTTLKFPGVLPTGPLPASVDFPLYPVDEPSQFDVLFFGDPQPRDQKEIDYIAHDVVEQLIGTDAAFGVTLGDILFDDLSLFDSFNRTVGKIGVPWYNVIGNHDINYACDVDELSDETYERVYGPAYYSFDYGNVHFLVVDDVHWMREGEKRFYRTGLSDKQLTFIENDLKQVPQDRLVVAMMHIPLVKSTPWVEGKRERLFRILEGREHCISLSGHTHHHEHVMIDSADGWKGDRPHHHIINVTVCGSWWSGKPDEHGIPHSTCADGTPNGFSMMRFDGTNYLLEYRAARTNPEYQVRVTAPEVVPAAEAAGQFFYANVFNAMPGAVVEWQTGNGQWKSMTKTTDEPDPLFKALSDEEQALLPDNLPWRKLASPMVCPHLWKAPLGDTVTAGTYTITVRATNPNGQVLTGHRVIRIAD
ncbi:MAG: calcineurin-like phosphoesterase family protein [Planctomycetaceae bacterium]|nr:calcineurin-like phosphoesterase family protein [Planctomycetaceae bacterium]